VPKFSLKKLVRDKIVDLQIASGQKPVYRIADKDEHKRLLVTKLHEEATEAILTNPQRAAAELADVQQVLDDLTELLGVTKEALAEAQAAKNAKSGCFKRGVYVDYLELEDNDPWLDYYRSDPQRFPEEA
jgi:predicted house-cleaning noncanonical NTP pyrophosphatase (MazG superfamily)